MPQLTSQLVQSDQPPTQSTGQGSLLHQHDTVDTTLSLSTQLLSHSNVREVTPLSPQVCEHSPQSVHDPVQSPSQGSPPHASRRVASSAYSHGLPPFCAVCVTTNVLYRLPIPQVTSHEPQMLHPPEQSRGSGNLGSVVVPVVSGAAVVVAHATPESQLRSWSVPSRLQVSSVAVKVRVDRPFPQAASHELHSLHSPSQSGHGDVAQTLVSSPLSQSSTPPYAASCVVWKTRDCSPRPPQVLSHTDHAPQAPSQSTGHGDASQEIVCTPGNSSGQMSVQKITELTSLPVFVVRTSPSSTSS